MTAINLWQLETVATFLEKSRDHLELEHAIRLRWPLASGEPARFGASAAQRPRAAKARNLRSVGATSACLPAVR